MTELKHLILHNKDPKKSSITAQDFKVFVDAVLHMASKGGPDAYESKTSRQLDFATGSSKRYPIDEYANNLRGSHDLKALHMCHSLSQYCVNNKLKSPLGKAQDTLTTIEKVIRSTTVALLEGKTAGVSMPGVRALLVFFECLERSMCNAYNGSAVFATQPGKTVATFFAANKGTCVGWIARLRMAVMQLAFFAGDYGYVVRNAQGALERMAARRGSAASGAVEAEWEMEFLKSVVLVAVSLCRLKCDQGLEGLYTWCKENAGGRKFHWMNDFARLVKNKSELGAVNLKETLGKIVAETTSSYYDAATVSVLDRELLFNCIATCDFDAYADWMKTYRERRQQTSEGLSPLSELEYKDSNALLLALSEFGDGAAPETVREPAVSEPFSTDALLTSCHLKLLEAASRFQRARRGHTSMAATAAAIADYLSSADSSLRLLHRDHLMSAEEEQQAAILSMVHRELRSLAAHDPTVVNGSRLDLLLTYKNASHRSRQLLWIKKWGDFFYQYQKVDYPQLAEHLNALNLEISKTARREENFDLSYLYLFKALIGGFHSTAPKERLAGYVHSLNFSSAVLSPDRTACIRQYAKLSHLNGDREGAVRAMCGIANSVGQLVYHADPSVNEQPELFNEMSRSLHSLATWFRRDQGLLDAVYPEMAPSSNYSSGGVTLTDVLHMETCLMGPVDFLPVVEQAADSDMVIGRLLRHAVNQAPLMAKLWRSLASWSSDLGDRVLEACQKGGGGVVLTEEERQVVLDCLPEATKSQLDEVFSLVQQHRLSQSSSKLIEQSKSDYMRSELAACEALAGNEPAVEQVLQVWLQVQKRTYFYLETAVNAYFHYITLHSSSGNGGGGGGDGNKNGDQLIAATLRLLQLTVRHALELQESLQAGLEATPSSKWKAIIPQLFSRLNHPVRAVRNRISELICRIAEDFPHLIIYPTVVGATSSLNEADKFYKHLTSVVEDADDADEEEDEDVSTASDDANPEMRSAYAQIQEAMVRRCGAAVEQVQRFVHELQRISLLWDELWMGTLQQHSHDVAKRVRKMEEEALRLSRNRALSEEEKRHLALDKYNIIFKPLLYVFEKVAAITEKEAETPHEAAFHKKYRQYIADMMDRLRSPADPSKPSEAWDALSKLYNTLSSKYMAKTALKLSDISPTLHALRRTKIPMPGLTDSREVDIESVENGLSVLLTKTKPKKVALLGNDGRKYTYLFKGLEDLHLDERIMQFLTIANVMMRSAGDDYRARHYSVVPLGPRSGLIQWVGGALPLFNIYKKYQIRQQVVEDAKAKKTTTETKIQKPSEAFYNKLYPLLRDRGVEIENRRAWPISIMRQVMQELIKETPDDYLSQELWYASVDSRHWFELTRRITRSVAVMSVIGYVIGLGDRHLDNLLMDFKRGEVIHIDHNICFEKGKNLRIPERVPCRLTQNVVRLFGLTGVEGVFRSACEQTLESLRGGKDTLMCLLEAFIYDPLVDWTPGVFELGFAGAYHGGVKQGGGGVDAAGDSAARDKRNMQSEITFSMYGVRVAEMRGPWSENKEDLLKVLGTLDDRLAAWTEQKATVDGLTERLSRMHHSMAILKEAEANPGHRLYSLHDRYVEHNMIETAVKTAKEKVARFVEENEARINLYQRAAANVAPANLAKWHSELTSAPTSPNASSAIVKDFLEKAGQSQLVEQFQNVESSFCIGVENLRQTLLACLQLLGHYGAVSSLYPQSYRQSHRGAQIVRLAGRMAENFTLATGQEIIADFTGKFIDVNAGTTSDDDSRRLKQHHLLNINYSLEGWASENGMRLQNIFQRMLHEGIESGPAVLAQVSTAKTELFQQLAASGEAGKDRAAATRAFGDAAAAKLASLAIRMELLERNAAAAGSEGISEVAAPDRERSLLDDIRMQLGVAAGLADAMEMMGAMQQAYPSVEAIQAEQKVMRQLAQFTSNFFTIVMPEGLKNFQKEEQTGKRVDL